MNEQISIIYLKLLLLLDKYISNFHFLWKIRLIPLHEGHSQGLLVWVLQGSTKALHDGV